MIGVTSSSSWSTTAPDRHGYRHRLRELAADRYGPRIRRIRFHGLRQALQPCCWRPDSRRRRDQRHGPRRYEDPAQVSRASSTSSSRTRRAGWTRYWGVSTVDDLTSLRICKRCVANVNRSVARQPFSGRHRGTRRAVPLLLTSLERRHAPTSGGIPAATLPSERSSLSPAIRRLRER